MNNALYVWLGLSHQLSVLGGIKNAEIITLDIIWALEEYILNKSFTKISISNKIQRNESGGEIYKEAGEPFEIYTLFVKINCDFRERQSQADFPWGGGEVKVETKNSFLFFLQADFSIYDKPLGNIPGHNTTDSVQATWKGLYHFEHLFCKGLGHKRTFKVNLVHSKLPR